MPAICCVILQTQVGRHFEMDNFPAIACNEMSPGCVYYYEHDVVRGGQMRANDILLWIVGAVPKTSDKG